MTILPINMSKFQYCFLLCSVYLVPFAPVTASLAFGALFGLLTIWFVFRDEPQDIYLLEEYDEDGEAPH